MQSQGDFVDLIVGAAIDMRASDVHFQPEHDGLKIRFRIDGLLQDYQELKEYLQDVASVISRLKILAKMDTAEKRIPQDGHFELNHNDSIYNIRVSTIPTNYGEAIVLRIFNRSDVLLNMEKLGLDQDQLQGMYKFMVSPSGMILITGPTGSGKTNFLYSMLHRLNRPEKNIMTLEDPIEYQMPNIRQTQINEAINFGFAKAIRSVVRQDPDIVMLGEIRDRDTASWAVQLSLVGMLVLSTFHTFDIPGLVTRFLEMGVSNSVTAQSIQAVIASRLLRKVCPNCRVQYNPTEGELRIIGNHISGVQTLYRGKGCASCKSTGYLGRTGVFHIVYFDDDIRGYISEKKPVAELYKLLATKTPKSFYTRALDKAVRGETTVAEVVRILGFPSHI